jgi:hypothetical protein
MRETFTIQSDFPCPPPPRRGRTPGSHDRNFERKSAAIRKGAAFAQEGQTFTDAAKRIQSEYPRPNTSIKHLAKLIRIKCNNQR